MGNQNELEAGQSPEVDCEQIVSDASSLLGCPYKDVIDRLKRVIYRSDQLSAAANRVLSMGKELEQLSLKLKNAGLL